MPLADGYEAEKELKINAEAAAEGITDYLISIGKEKRYGFAIFMFDIEESILQYISDMPREEINRVLKHWLERNVQ